MKRFIESFTRKVIMYFYPKVFGEVPGKGAMGFMRNLSLVFFGIAISKVFSVLFQIYTGRVLGPGEYGKFTMVVSLSNFFWIPMVLGLAVALVKYLAEDRSDDEKKKIISTSISMVLLLTLASTLLLTLFSSHIAAFSNVTQNCVFGAILLAILLSMWTMSERVWRGMNKMKKISLANIVMNVLFLGTALVLFVFSNTAFVPIAAMAVGYALASSFALPELRRYFRPKIDRKWGKTLLKYGSIVILSTVAYTINTNINKILINVFLTFSEVGLYQAYSFSTLNVASFFITTFIIVFFPAASREKDKKMIFRKMNRMFKLYPLVFVAVLSLAFIILFLYGREYAISLPLILLFSLVAIVDINFFAHTWFSSSMGISGVKNTGYATAIAATAGMVMAYILIPQFGIYGAIMSTLASFLAGSVYIRHKIWEALA